MNLISTKVCKKGDIGVHNNLFGGTMLSWVDEAGVAMAAQYCFTPLMVTVKMDELIFLAPVKVNNIVKIYGNVIAIGNTSITISIEVRRCSVYTQEEQLVLSTHILFCRIDEEGRAIPISKHVKRIFKTEQESMRTDSE
ncbi:acyl-CoA thioesterase [bacterium]|nr:acyl-CoA thioesterase [bacterium]|tara:strand:- start:2187 stop:2603 length:417 start_codon:yes stop_codon:yes gene_type:complete